MADKDKAPATIRMTRSREQAGDGPTEADVHPNEVENHRAAGFTEADQGKQSQDKE